MHIYACDIHACDTACAHNLSPTSCRSVQFTLDLEHDRTGTSLPSQANKPGNTKPISLRFFVVLIYSSCIQVPALSICLVFRLSAVTFQQQGLPHAHDICLFSEDICLFSRDLLMTYAFSPDPDWNFEYLGPWLSGSCLLIPRLLSWTSLLLLFFVYFT